MQKYEIMINHSDTVTVTLHTDSFPVRCVLNESRRDESWKHNTK